MGVRYCHGRRMRAVDSGTSVKGTRDDEETAGTAGTAGMAGTPGTMVDPAV